MNKSEKELLMEELKRKYKEEKSKLDKIRSNATIEKWKILSRAYKIGRKIWGHHFSRQRLSFDMEIPLTTTLRCLALDKANKKTWKLINSDKISAFKVAQICQSRNKHYQDEIVDMVIENNMSTYNIKKMKINCFSDINKERHRLACEEGYSRKSSAYEHFNHWIIRGNMFMLIKKENLPEGKIEDLEKGLKDLKKNINNYIKKIKDKQ